MKEISKLPKTTHSPMFSGVFITGDAGLGLGPLSYECAVCKKQLFDIEGLTASDADILECDECAEKMRAIFAKSE